MMRRRSLMQIAMLVGLLCCLQTSTVTPAAESPAAPPKFDTPAAVISAAEDAFVSRDFKTFANCFDVTGQKVLSEDGIKMLALFAGLNSDSSAHDKAVLAKYGLTDLSRPADESDDHFAERLAAQLKDPTGFIAEAMPLLNTDSFSIKFPKGKLMNLTIDGKTAKAAYLVVVSPKNTMTQDMTFVQTDDSWKISSDMFFPAPAEVNNQ